MKLYQKLLMRRGEQVFENKIDSVITYTHSHEFAFEKLKAYIKDKKVLDVGCWNGAFELLLREKGINVDLLGIDENLNAINVAQKQFNEFRFKRIDITEDFDLKELFDTIILIDVIEHLQSESVVKSLGNLDRHLKVGSKLILSTMHLSPYTPLDLAWYFGHRHYSLINLIKLLKKFNYKIENIFIIGNFYWELDAFFFYFFKHIMNRKYKSPDFIRRKIKEGFKQKRFGSRIYMLLTKN